MRFTGPFIGAVTGVLLATTGTFAQDPCVVPDNGTGTVTLPPQGCEYLSPDEVHEIIDGLPAGTTIELAPIHKDFICFETQSCSVPIPPGECERGGGGLGGQVDCFTSQLEFQLIGTGDLAGFNRTLTVPVECEVHTAPRNPGDPVQSFDTEMFRLQGQIFGDPDFDSLIITGGSDNGLPSPGHTTLTDLGNGNFNVDSFFDIEYRIDFQGAPGSALEGMAGSTQATIRMATGNSSCIPPGEDCFTTACDGNTLANFANNPIPAGFFDPGSEPFTGTIQLGGASGGGIDTVVQRLDQLCFSDPLPSTATVPIEIVALDLVSCQPITVDHNDGTTSQWDVQVGLEPTQPQGLMEVTKEDPNGGTFTADLPVVPAFVFTEVGNPGNVKPFNPGIVIPLDTIVPSPWTTDETLDQCTQDGFFPGGSNQDPPCCEETCHSAGDPANPDHMHCTMPPGCPACPDPVCEPNDDLSGCQEVLCPDPTTERCLAKCINFDPTTGNVDVVLCECQPADQCHMQLGQTSSDGTTSKSGGGVIAGGNDCVVPDDGGTVELPPQGCEYLSPDEVHEIIDGLPAGTTIELAPIHKDFICNEQPGANCSLPLDPLECEDNGGSLGGQFDCFQSNLELQVNGTGTLGGFNRVLNVPISCEVHTAPRNPGDPVQTFATDMFRLQGELFGDPDFCTLRIRGGTDLGLPSPGQTTLTQLPGGDWNVDSFFDITYEIEFQGCPGSVLDGYAGTTTATIRMETGQDSWSCVGNCPPGETCVETITQLADGTYDICCECVPEQVDCAPDPNDPLSCLPVTCPDLGDECIPRCMVFDSVTGAVSVTDCECRQPNECHVEPAPIPTESTAGDPCVVPDDAGGTVTLPPAGCEYLSPDEVHMIIDGLPAGTTIELAAIHKDFICDRQGGDGFPGCPPPGVCEDTGGDLGGNVDCFDSQLELELTGTGDLAGFSRTLVVPIQCQVHTGPRNPGDPVQEFDTKMEFLQGGISGDPDFDFLSITGGDGNGLPSPGHTTLTRLGPPGSDFTVDSFFDITYRIDFQGAPGSQLEGLAGSTTGNIRMESGFADLPVCVGDCPVGQVCEESRFQLPDGSIEVCCDCVTPDIQVRRWESIKEHGGVAPQPVANHAIPLNHLAPFGGPGVPSTSVEPRRFEAPGKEDKDWIAIVFNTDISAAHLPGNVVINVSSTQPGATGTITLDTETVTGPGNEVLLLELDMSGQTPFFEAYCVDIDISASIAGLVGDGDCQFRVQYCNVAGGTPPDLSTNLIDYAQVKGNNGADVTDNTHPLYDPTLAPQDWNLDGKVNLIDAAETKVRNGRTSLVNGCP